MTRQMLLGSDGLGQSGELLGSQNLCKLAIGRGGDDIIPWPQTGP